MIRILLACLVACAAVSCNSPAHVSVTTPSNHNIAIDSSARVGGRGGVLVKSDNVTVAVYDNNDDSFREGNKTLRFGIGLIGLSSLANTAADAATSINATNKAAETSINAAVQQTNQLKITSEAATEAAKLAVP